MEDFNLDSHLDRIYSSFPEANPLPVIGLTADYSDINATIRSVYYKQVVAAGGIPVLVPPVADKNIITGTLERLDGLILTGGSDLNPLWYDEEPSPQLHNINKERDLAELLITRLAYNRQIPILGICRGIQTLSIALGGKVSQNINNEIKHDQEADRSEPTHSITLAADSILYDIYHTDRIFVNSFHHQAVSVPGKKLKIIATSPDNVIEAVESNEYKSILGVQWHPEWLGEDGLPIFKWLVKQADCFAAAKKLQERILTLDSHCDTPMFFPQGVEFDHRDPRILYDLHKMHEGRTDAVTMVAYLPQPKMGETFSSKINLAGIIQHNPDLAAHYPNLLQDIPSISPNEYADLIFDKIEEIAYKRNEHISIARTPQDLYADKRNGRKSIMLGIENGLALNHNLANIKHFAQRGIVYITLCHNGDNDICDSARGCNTHNGVSLFGEKVIEEMNHQGIMVDLSHGNEKSFYDALDISKTPVVCSHSNCKALCDVPRNLSDDQLRAIASHNGVAQITLYHGFLKKEGEVSILDAMEHLEHAVKIMGIDHVGLGTDFDGDGGIKGIANASELINFTLQLLRRRYSERDIEKIWGGNWLRVMTTVQNAKQ